MDIDRLSILEKIELGEISVDDAKLALEKASQEAGIGDNHEMRYSQELAEGPEEDNIIPTRDERKNKLAIILRSWEPQVMFGLNEGQSKWIWPWEKKKWQWMWQNIEYPVYVDHYIDTAEKSELKIVSYQGDLIIRGWNKPNLKINGAAFDTRIGQDENTVRIACSTGQLLVWVPSSVASIQACVKPGDMWISNISSNLDIYCQSGDLACEKIKGNIKSQVNGGDARLVLIEGSINANVMKGNCEARGIKSKDVALKVTEGNIWLTLDLATSGSFRCENKDGDINLIFNGEMSGELLAEAIDGGRIAPVMLPWKKLLGRSESKIHGIIKGEGAFINLITRSGKIYIQESLMYARP